MTCPRNSPRCDGPGPHKEGGRRTRCAVCSEQRIEALEAEAAATSQLKTDFIACCQQLKDAERQIDAEKKLYASNDSYLREQLKGQLRLNSEIAKALADLLDCLENTGNWTESGDSFALWLTQKEEKKLDDLENRAREVLNGVIEKRSVSGQKCVRCDLPINSEAHLEECGKRKCVCLCHQVNARSTGCSGCGLHG